VVKGKYGVRAANRIVQTDNELLRAKIAECQSLKSECDGLKQEVEYLRRHVNGAAMRHGAELAAAELSRARSEIESVRAEFDEYRARVAVECWELYKEFGATLGEGSSWDRYFEKYVAIFGLQVAQQAELISISNKNYQGSRFNKRAARKIKKIRSVGTALRDNPSLRINEVAKDEML
jgi:hypothetical protein